MIDLLEWFLDSLLYFLKQVLLSIWDAISFIYRYREFKKSQYSCLTGCSWKQVRNDKGMMGEYLIYRHLKKLDSEGKWLFNLYLPKNESNTTEVDVVFIHASGIYVFESKNFAGWIFGDENQVNWTQTLRERDNTTQKNHFYNPILQNEGHIRVLRLLFPHDYPFHSIIVFGNNCVLKHLTVKSDSIMVLQTRELKELCQMIQQMPAVLTESEIQYCYLMLSRYSHVCNTVKQNHIDTIQSQKG